jgi:hypothetical protein
MAEIEVTRAAEKKYDGTFVALCSIHQDQHEQNQDNESDSAAGTVTPGSAVAPRSSRSSPTSLLEVLLLLSSDIGLSPVATTIRRPGKAAYGVNPYRTAPWGITLLACLGGSPPSPLVAGIPMVI